MRSHGFDNERGRGGRGQGGPGHPGRGDFDGRRSAFGPFGPQFGGGPFGGGPFGGGAFEAVAEDAVVAAGGEGRGAVTCVPRSWRCSRTVRCTATK